MLTYKSVPHIISVRDFLRNLMREKEVSQSQSLVLLDASKILDGLCSDLIDYDSDLFDEDSDVLIL